MDSAEGHDDVSRRTYLLVDGENIDATLGNSVLGRRPHPEERPRWERVTEFLRRQWGHPVTGLFFLNASGGNLPASFVQALLAMEYRPVPLAGRADEKVVDIGIQRTLDALLARPDADVVLVSHDSDFAEHLTQLLTPEGIDGDLTAVRRVGLMGFREFTSTQLVVPGVELFDLEHDVAAFNTALPRTRIIPLDEFDPEFFLR